MEDTYHGMKVADYLPIVISQGFEQVLEEAFGDERLFIFFHPDGIFLKFDTYRGQDVNGGTFHYNVVVRGDIAKARDAFSTGHYADDQTFVGHHDCRVGFCKKLKRLRAVGHFLNPWKYDPGVVWIVHHGDAKQTFGETANRYVEHHKYSQMAAEKTIKRAALLPANVQACIAVSIRKLEEELERCKT
jgi:hypothetical protein